MDIIIKNLCKKYRTSNIFALNNMNLEIKPGIFGLIGENGAGKTTLIKILTTLTSPSSGTVYFDDKDIQQNESLIRSHIGYLPQHFDFFGNFTVIDAMNYIATLKSNDSIPVSELNDLLDDFHLLNKANVKIKNLSGGMKQRLGIAQAFVNNPSVIILDEPTVGLDPSERLNFRNVINKHAAGKTILLSSHIISDISMLCNNIAIIKSGTILYSGSTIDIIKMMKGTVFNIICDSNARINPDLEKHIISISKVEEGISIRFFNEDGFSVDGAKPVEPTLEDAYFKFVLDGGKSGHV